MISVLAFLIGLLVIPLVRRVCIAVGMVDRPDAHRKIHGREIAVGGGIGVLLTTVIALGVFAFLSDTWSAKANQRTTEFAGLALAAGIICAVGLWDDSRGLSGKKKLLGQAFAVIVAVATGPAIQDISLFGFPLHLGVFVYPFCVFWVLAAINAVNLIDGMDGLASSVGASMMAALAIIGLWNNHPADALIALAIAGALFAFLVYNFYPASIFLGDTGAMLIGLTVGTLLLRATLSTEGVVPVAVCIAVMTIPLFDTTAAIIRRKFTGRSIYTTDRGHIHHCFRKNGMNVRWTMSCIALLSVMAGLGAIASIATQNDLFAIIGSGFVVAVLAATRSFGHSELDLIGRYVWSFAKSFVVAGGKNALDHDLRVRLQGEGNWEELWDELKAASLEMGFSRVRLDVNLPMMHEGYYAEWRNRRVKEDDAAWSTVVPLVVNKRVIGRVELVSNRNDGTSFPAWLHSVGGLLESVEDRVAFLVNSRQAPDSKPVVVHLTDDPAGMAPKMSSKLLGKEPMTSAS